MADLIPPRVLYFPWYSRPSAGWLKSALLLADGVDLISGPREWAAYPPFGGADLADFAGPDSAAIGTLGKARLLGHVSTWDSFPDAVIDRTRTILSSLTPAELPVLEERFARVLDRDGLGGALSRYGPAPHPSRALAMSQIRPTPGELSDVPPPWDGSAEHPVTRFRAMLDELGHGSRVSESPWGTAPLHTVVEVPALVAGIHRYAMALTFAARRGDTRLCTDDVQAFALSGVGGRPAPDTTPLPADSGRLMVTMRIATPDLDALPMRTFVKWHADTAKARKDLRAELNKRLMSLPGLTATERQDVVADLADTAGRRLTDRLSRRRGELTRGLTLTTVVPVVGGALDLALHMGGPGAVASIAVGAAGAMTLLRGRFTANDWSCYLLSARRLVETGSIDTHQELTKLIRWGR